MTLKIVGTVDVENLKTSKSNFEKPTKIIKQVQCIKFIPSEHIGVIKNEVYYPNITGGKKVFLDSKSKSLFRKNRMYEITINISEKEKCGIANVVYFNMIKK